VTAYQLLHGPNVYLIDFRLEN